MKGWRERASDIFAKHGEIASRMKSAPGPDPSDFQLLHHSLPHQWGPGTPRQAWLNYHDERNMNHKQTEM